MKKILSLLLAVTIIATAFTALPFTVSAAEAVSAEVGASSGTTGDCTWTLDDEGTLTISGNGDMDNYGYESYSPWGIDIKKVIIEDGVTSIGDSAFYDCTNLESVTIPDSVTSIGMSAFNDCINLESITIPDSVEYIGTGAFSYCMSLKSITIPDGVTSIDFYTFYWCTSLESVTIPDGVKSIGYKAFYGTSLASVTIPDSVTGIDDRAFGYIDYYYDYESDEEHYVPAENFTIYGVSGTEAWRYANENGFIFIPIGEEVTPIGDSNGDGNVDVLDAAAIQKFAAGKADMTDAQQHNADVNGDNNVDILDATEIQKFAAGKITEFKKKT